jgi:DinB superfamily
MSFIGSLIHFFVERRASGANLDELRKSLETGCDKVSARMASAQDTPANRKQAAHVIGIERWSAHRLGAAVSPSAPPELDEYDSYRPGADQPMSVLAQEFRDARAETLARLDALPAQPDRRIPHNELGNLSLRGWLVYLNSHASVESRKLKS